MAASGATKVCPRCNSVLPATAAFCGTCGYHLTGGSPEPASQGGATPQSDPSSLYDAPTQYAQYAAPGAPSAPQDAASQYNEPAAPGSRTQQPGYPPPAQPDYGSYPPAGQPGSAPPPPGYGGYPAGPAVVTAKRGGATKWLVALLALVVVVGGVAAAWFFYLSPSRCSGPLFDRHGLQSNVPLPANCAYKDQRTFSSAPNASPQVTADEWFWTVDKSDPTAVQQFYESNLANNGWSEKHPSGLGSSTPDVKDIYACQGNQLLFLETAPSIPVTDNQGNTVFTLQAPAGGAALAIALTTSQSLRQIVCSG